MTPVLSILVPTFNRMADLARLMPRLLEVLDLHSEVDLIISNNASTDGTADFLESLPVHERLRTVHQPVNYGPNLHLAWLYGQSRGTHLWMLCDDDVFVPGTVERILTVLRERPDLGWIHLPHVYLKTMQPETAQAESESPATDQYYAAGRELSSAMAQWVTFISSNIIRAEFVRPEIGRLRFDTLYWPFRLLVIATLNSPAVVLSGRWIKGGPDISWKDSIHEVTNVHLPKTVLGLDCWTRSEKKAALSQIFRVEPDRLERLMVISPEVFVRVVCFHPRLLAGFCSSRFFGKLFKNCVWRRLVNGFKTGMLSFGAAGPPR